MKTSWARSEILGKRVLFLVDVRFAGVTVRVSTESFVVPSDDGDLHYAGTAEAITVSEELELFQLAASPVSVGFAAYWPIDVVGMVRRGHVLAGCPVEISQWVPGSAYEDRRVVLRGRIQDPEFGENGFVNCSIEENLFEDPVEIPLPGWEMREGKTVGISLVQVLGSADIGVPYPIVIGYPGRDPQSITGKTSGSRCIWMSKSRDNHFLMVSYGHVGAAEIPELDQAGAPVWLNHDAATTALPFRVLAGYDDAGVPISYINDAGSVTGTTNDGLETGEADGAGFTPTTNEVVDVFAAWPEGGGIRNERGRVIRGAGDVLLFLLRFASVPVDTGAFAAVAPALNAYRIDTSIDARCSLADYLTQRLLPLLPVSLCSGPAGLYPVLWRPDAGPADAVAHIDADLDPRIEVAEVVEVDNAEIFNDFTLSYGYSRRTDRYQYQARIGAEYVPGTARAAAQFVWNASERIRVEAIAEGLPGAGIRVVFTTGALGVTDGANLVTLSFVNTTSTTADIVGALNGSTLVRADAIEDNGGSWAAAGVEDADQVLVLADDAVLPDARCAWSQRELRDDERRDSGLRPLVEETPLVYDKSTAYAILGWKAAAWALPRLRVTMRVPMDDWGWLRRGNTVTFTRAALGFARHVGTVEALEWASDGMLGVRLVFLANPARDAYAA